MMIFGVESILYTVDKFDRCISSILWFSVRKLCPNDCQQLCINTLRKC